jgi:putative tryptophan/tyrosine transport system substrate-binding protein
MRRRGFLGVLGSAVVAWSVAARAQERVRVRRIGVIMIYAEADPEGQARLSALRDRLHKLGWTEGSNIQIDVRWAAGESDRMRADAVEFVSMPVEVIVANSTPLIGMLKSLTQKIPIVFAQVADPVSSGFVTNYARPTGNITGFTDFDTSIAGKWIEILKEAAPFVSQVTVLTDPKQSNHHAFLNVIEITAPSLKIQILASGVSDRVDIEQAIAALAAGQTDRGLIILPGPVNNTLRDSIIKLAARYRLPAIYPFKYYAKEGGLLCYGINQVEQWSNAASYVDRILKGEKPADLPVQAPSKYELTINLKTAKALGLDIPSALLGRADEVIE